MLQGILFFNTETPTFFEQNMDAGQDFDGLAPLNLESDGEVVYGGIAIPFDPANHGGLFDFVPRKTMQLLSIDYNLDTGMAAALHVQKQDTTLVPLVTGLSGEGGQDMQIILHPREKVVLTSSGASGVKESRFRMYVKNHP